MHAARKFPALFSAYEIWQKENAVFPNFFLAQFQAFRRTVKKNYFQFRHSRDAEIVFAFTLVETNIYGVFYNLPAPCIPRSKERQPSEKLGEEFRGNSVRNFSSAEHSSDYSKVDTITW